MKKLFLLLFCFCLIFCTGCNLFDKDNVENFKSQMKDSSRKDNVSKYNAGVDLYNKGIKYDRNGEYEKAIECYKEAAEKYDETMAMVNLGAHYSNGEGVNQNDEEAFKWSKMAAERGNDIAQCNLGINYQHGEGCIKNEEEAFKWYQKSAKQDNIHAIVLLGQCYRDGIGVEPNKEEAFKNFRTAAEKDDPDGDGQNLLACAYLYGQGCEKDLDKAKYWLKKSVEKGNENGKHNLEIFFGE